MSDLDVVAGALTAAGVTRVYKFGAVPALPAAPYCVVNLDTGDLVGTRVDGRSPTTVRFLSVQMFGLSWEAVVDMAQYADTVFGGRVLTGLPGEPFSRREIATSPIRDPDGEKLLYILHTYRL